ncbi:MAG: hypothetical protein J0M24_13880 [Verrucomicrobia bacterium]|nr:hypothetical protein [Verrucomicrobiota bacterium]
MTLVTLAFFADQAAHVADGSSAAGAIWLTGAFAAAGGVTAVINLAALFATRREVESLEKRLGETRAELAATRKELTAELAQARHEMGEMERRLNSNSEERAVQTHDRINDVLSAVSNLAGRFGVDTHK